MFKRRTITLTAIISLALSAFALTNVDIPQGLGLENNEEYQQLVAESEILAIKADSLLTLTHDTRMSMRNYMDTVTTEPSRELLNSYSSRIVMLEDEYFKITAEQGVVASRISEIELAAIERGFNESMSSRQDNDTLFANDLDTTEESTANEEVIVDEPTEESTANEEVIFDEPIEEQTTTEEEIIFDEPIEEQTTTEEEVIFDEPIEEQTTNEEFIVDEPTEEEIVNEQEPVRITNVIDSELFNDTLISEDIEDLRTAQQEVVETDTLVQEYLSQYAQFKELVAQYKAATKQSVADPLYDKITATYKTLESLNAEINSKWNHVIDTKYYAYGLVIETQRNKALLSKLDDEFNTLLQQCAENDNLYASNGVMRYAICRPAIIDFEIIMTSELGLNDVCEVLTTERESLSIPTYQLSPIDIPERRLFINYKNISFGRTNHYNESNPLPKLKVYERGTIYRILLGQFKSRQPMTLFKGVQPLYLDKDSAGLNNYYAGGFASLEEAEAAQKLLFERGFKGPEICVWRDGVMTNLTAGSNVSASDQTITTGSVRYMLRIANEDMTDALRQYVTQTYPSKRITLTNSGYVIGSFDNHDEVTRLFIALSDEFGIDLEIMEVEK